MTTAALLVAGVAFGWFARSSAIGVEIANVIYWQVVAVRRWRSRRRLRAAAARISKPLRCATCTGLSQYGGECRRLDCPWHTDTH